MGNTVARLAFRKNGSRLGRFAVAAVFLLSFLVSGAWGECTRANSGSYPYFYSSAITSGCQYHGTLYYTCGSYVRCACGSSEKMGSYCQSILYTHS